MGIFDESSTEAVPLPLVSRYSLSEEDREQVRIQVTEMMELREQASALTKRVDFLKKQVLSRFPADPGEHTMPVKGGEIIVSIGEALEFDEDEIAKIVDPSDLPPFCSMKLKIDKKAFEAMSAAERDKYLSALTIKPTRHTINFKASK